MTTTLEIREPRADETGAILRAMQAAFAANDRRSANPAAHTESAAEWRWAFDLNPAGRRALIAVQGDYVAGFFGGWPLRVLIQGEVTTFTLVVDAFVHPDRRAGLRRTSVYVELAREFFARYGGRDRDLVHFGWPVERSLRVGAAKLGYRTLRPELVLVRATSAAEPVPPDDARRRAADESSVSVLTEFDGTAVWLYERCAGAWGASVLRDAAYLNWRFVRHPTRRYEILGVRDANGLLRGTCVWRPATFGGDALAVVLDWLVPPSEPHVATRLLEVLSTRASSRGLGHVCISAPPWSHEFADFQARGFRVHAPGPTTFVRTFHPRWDESRLRASFWYQLGESDAF